jgi:pimeloyl-ACP methyl ester carboxylesterase
MRKSATPFLGNGGTIVGYQPVSSTTAKRLVHARVALLDGAGHLPHFEQAANITALVGEFLKN